MLVLGMCAVACVHDMHAFSRGKAEQERHVQVPRAAAALGWQRGPGCTASSAHEEACVWQELAEVPCPPCDGRRRDAPRVRRPGHCVAAGAPGCDRNAGAPRPRQSRQPLSRSCLTPSCPTLCRRMPVRWASDPCWLSSSRGDAACSVLVAQVGADKAEVRVMHRTEGHSVAAVHAVKPLV